MGAMMIANTIIIIVEVTHFFTSQNKHPNGQVVMDNFRILRNPWERLRSWRDQTLLQASRAAARTRLDGTALACKCNEYVRFAVHTAHSLLQRGGPAESCCLQDTHWRTAQVFIGIVCRATSFIRFSRISSKFIIHTERPDFPNPRIKIVNIWIHIYIKSSILCLWQFRTNRWIYNYMIQFKSFLEIFSLISHWRAHIFRAYLLQEVHPLNFPGLNLLFFISSHRSACQYICFRQSFGDIAFATIFSRWHKRTCCPLTSEAHRVDY